jgi:hypothetical protein
MGSVLNMKESKSFCDEVFTQLTDMRVKILELKERSTAGIPKTDIDGGKFVRHLTELADVIDWKLQILSHSCAFDWKGAAEYEADAQVNGMSRAPDSDTFSGGYVGG